MTSASNRPAAAGALPPVLCGFCATLLGLTAFSVAYSLVATYGLHAKYPYGLPYFYRTDVDGWDFTVFSLRFAHFRTASFWDAWDYPFTYPAPLGVLFGLLYRLSHPMVWYLGGCTVALLAGAGLFVKEMRRRGVAGSQALLLTGIVLFTCWPLFFLYNRGNIEGVVVVAASLGVLALFTRRPWTGAALIGIAGAMKIFPLLLLGLLLSDRRYTPALFGLLIAGLITVGSLAILGPSVPIALANIVVGLQFFRETWAANLWDTGIGFDHSLFTVAKIPLALAYRATHAGQMHAYEAMRVLRVGPGGGSLPHERAFLGRALTLYSAVATLAGLALYFAGIRKLPQLNQLLALSVCAVLLPPVSYDYTLLHLLVPLALLCLYAVDARRTRHATAGLHGAFIGFAFVLTLDTYCTLAIHLAGQLRAVALLALLVVVLRFPFELPSDAGEREDAGLADRKPVRDF